MRDGLQLVLPLPCATIVARIRSASHATGRGSGSTAPRWREANDTGVVEPSPDQHAGGGSPWLWAVMLTALLTPGAVAFALATRC